MFFFSKRKPESVSPAAVSAAPHASVADPAEAAAREDSRRRTGALQHAIANSTYFSSIATDENGLIQHFDAGAERMLGYSAAEVVGRLTPADIADPQEAIARAKALSLELRTHIGPGFGALVFKASRGIEDVHALTYVRKDGARFPAIVAVTALRDGGGTIIGYLLNGTDNSARLAAEAELGKAMLAQQQVIAALEQGKLAAERANLAKSDFLSSMSHELRAPLNAMLGFAQLLGSDTPPPSAAQQEHIDQILSAGWYLLELITEILDLSAIESGNLSLSVEPVAMAGVMRDCEAMVAPLAQKRGIRISFPTLAAPLFAHADHTRVKQVLVNLASNAIKYNQAGGIVEVQCVALDARRIRISVRDTGAGLTAEAQQQLFLTPRVVGAARGLGQGAGIGLVMSKRLVELMGGVIGVDSTVGVGSVFWFELEVASAPPLVRPATWSATNGANAPAADARPRTVLYVEDNPANLALVQQLIARHPGLRLLTAVNAALGVALARVAQPEVILMDINLPGLNGLKALALLRDDPLTAHIPVLAVSANAMPDDIERGIAAGFDRYLTKPIRAEEFMAALDATLASAAVRTAH